MDRARAVLRGLRRREDRPANVVGDAAAGVLRFPGDRCGTNVVRQIARRRMPNDSSVRRVSLDLSPVPAPGGRMFRITGRALALVAILSAPGFSQQAIDSAYTAKIKLYLQDPRITTELVDHLPASSTVPTPLKFFGRMRGTPGELTYAKDIQRYYEALDKASDRVKVWNIGKSEEGRDMFVLAVADEQTIRDLDKYKQL